MKTYDRLTFVVLFHLKKSAYYICYNYENSNYKRASSFLIYACHLLRIGETIPINSVIAGMP